MEAVAQAGSAPETPEQFIIRRDTEIKTWLDRKAALDSIKPQEMDARTVVAATLFPNPHKGTQRYHLNGGYAVKLVHGTTYTLGDKDKISGEGEDAVKIPVAHQVSEMLDRLLNHLIAGGKTQEEATAFCQGLVTWRPELNEKAYLASDASNNVMAAAKGIIDEILTTKPASPQLTFELPKEPK